MPNKLAEEVVVFYDTLKAENVLQNVDETKFCAIHGYGGAVCSDCDQVEDKLRLLDAITSLYRNEPRKHLIQLQGGAALIDPESLFNTMPSPLSPEMPPIPYHTVALEQIRIACVAKDNIEQFVLMVHDPCGMAKLYGANRKSMLCYLANAERIVKINFPHLRVSTMLHVDYGDGKKRTFHFSSTNWTRLLAKNTTSNVFAVSV
jgi:hypothetical protein